MSGREYKICARCVVDTSDPLIEFDEAGLCNHCRYYDRITSREIHDPAEGRPILDGLVAQAKRDGEGKKYDCIVGLSGGVDSSFLTVKAVKMGLRPLAIHLDNSWDSETAVRNIERIVRGLGLDLVTHVIDWQEFRDLQRSFFRAGVVDIELLSDHAITAMAMDVARDHGIGWVLSGTNHATESIMPTSWTHRKSDLRNLKAIHRRFGERPLRTFPTASMMRIRWYRHVKKIQSISVLNYIGYDREEAMATLESELGWRYYGGKHWESLFTRFYQAYILPTKFGFDKRRAHLSARICSGQTGREEALAELEQPHYPPRDVAHDREYVLKKLGFTEETFDRTMAEAPHSHHDYPSDSAYIVPLMKANHLRRRLIGRGPQS